jgi:hypothetical protein
MGIICSIAAQSIRGSLRLLERVQARMNLIFEPDSTEAHFRGRFSNEGKPLCQPSLVGFSYYLTLLCQIELIKEVDLLSF